jgi:hypothetical protein
MDRMIEALKLMGCPADVQIAALPDYVVVADEVALIFDDELCGLKLDTCMPEVRGRLIEIERRLSSMSDTKVLWTNDALQSADEWNGIRAEAAALLLLLGAAVERPDLSWVTYVHERDRAEPRRS